MRELNAIEDAFPALRTPDSPTQQVGGPPSTTFAPVEHLQRLMSLDNVFSREELDRWAPRAVRELGEERIAAVRLPLRAEGRRAGARPGLREGPAGPGGHPRRRPGRRGRHRQRAHDRGDPRTARRATTCPDVLGGARGGVLRRRGVRRAQRGAGRRRQGAVRQPAQRRGRLAAAEGPAGHRVAATSASSATASGCWRAFGCRPAVRRLRRAGGVGSAGQPAPQARAGPGRGVGLHRALRRAPALGRARDRRRRGQARRAAGAGPARLHLAGAALGDRVQVPAGGGHHQAARHPGQRRPDRTGHAVRRDGAGAGLRLDGRHGHAAQRQRGEAQGRADRRHRRAAQGRRRDPRDRRAGGRPAGRQRAASS